MIRTIEIKTLDHALEILLHQHFDEEIGRIRSDYLYRGMPSADYRLMTSLQRNCKSKAAQLEPSMLRYFAKYAVREDPDFSSSVWRQMVMGQHYGLPTRLLDWSHSALIAMHFATAEPELEMTDKRDGVIWRIDERELSAILPPKYRDILNRNRTDVFSIDLLSEAVDSAARYDADMNGNSMIVLEPPSSNQRIINQYSYFTMVPMGMDDIEDFLDRNTENTIRFIIDRSIRWKLRDLLDQLNVSERIIYPGLDGLSAWVARHYYVMDKDEK